MSVSDSVRLHLGADLRLRLCAVANHRLMLNVNWHTPEYQWRINYKLPNREDSPKFPVDASNDVVDLVTLCT